jgi:hypothetical protein
MAREVKGESIGSKDFFIRRYLCHGANEKYAVQKLVCITRRTRGKREFRACWPLLLGVSWAF